MGKWEYKKNKMRINIDNNKVFAYRVAGIARKGSKVLIHKSSLGHNWALPGGACEFGQSSIETLERELNEELGAKIKVGSLQFIVENFFEWEEKNAHELGLYYEYTFIEDSIHFYDQVEFEGHEEHDVVNGNHKLYFKWVELDVLASYDLKPSLLKKLLQERNLHPKHIIHYDNKCDI